MKTKCVYIVTSNGDDFYLEQTFLSVYSLKLHNPDANITLVVDENTEKSFYGVRKEILNIITDLKIIKCPKELSKMALSRYLKTSLRQQIDGNYLFIDGDTIIADKLDSVDEFDFAIGASIDKHLNISRHTQKSEILTKAKQINWDITQWDGRYYNSGVMYVKENPITIELYHRWHHEWTNNAQKGIFIDQPTLNKINLEMGGIISEIGGEWNCQIIDNGIKYLNRAKIIHYFASSIGKGSQKNTPYLFKNIEFYKILKNEGLTNEIKELLANPKGAFPDKVRLIDGSISDFICSPIGRLARKIDNKLPIINKLLNKFI